MKKRILPLIFALVLLIAAITCVTLISSAEDTATEIPTASQGEVIDLWLVAGQSNAIGAANVKNYPTDEAYAEYKTMLTNGSDNVWHIRNDYTEFVPTAFSQGSGTYSGPEIGIATALMNSTNKAAIVKVAYGNTCLYENTSSKESINYGTWTPPSYIDKYNVNTVGNRTGDLYLSFIAKAAEAVVELESKGYTVNLKGVWYMQGEADTLTSSTTTARYEELLLTLISDMRRDLSEISGVDCSELPFVYGRILSNHVNVGKDVPKKLTDVQTAQDNVAANTSLKNVFMVNTTTDLVDPVTGQHRLPVQQDGWHYDTLSQQMIGEKFVSVVNSVEGTFTKYGFLPKDTGSNPFAVFKKVDGSYVFDSYKNSFETAISRAVALTHITSGTTEEAVILAVKDYGGGNYGKEVANSGGTITLDLNGHTLSPSVALFTTVFSDSTASRKTVFNLKNGTMLFQQFGAMFTTGSTSKSQSFDFNVENMSFGFISGTQNKTPESFKYRDLLVSDRNCTTSGGAKVTINVNVTNSNFDLATNALSNATVGTFKECKTTDNCCTDYIVNFAGCKFVLQKPTSESDSNGKVATAIGGVVSSSGDVVKFIKGDGGAFGEITFKEAPTFDHIKALTFAGVDDGYDADIILRVKNGIYYLTTSSDVETPYGVIPAAYSNSYAYAYAIFKKVDGAYVFDSAQSNVQTSFERATALTHVKTGVTDDVVIYVRESIGKDGSFPYNVSDIGGTVTLDLNGYTIRPTTALLRTDWDDDGVVNGVQKTASVNVKNGSLEVCQFGLLFTTIAENGVYTVSKTFNFNLENVKLSFYETTKNQTGTRKYMDLIVSDRSNSSTVNSYINVTATNCVFDLESNARDVALLATLDCGDKDKDNNDYNLTIVGGSIITDNIGKVNCHTKGTGDSFTFGKDADGNYTKILIKQNLTEPASTEYRNGEDGKVFSLVETRDTVGIYKVYEMREAVVTKYGVIPYSAAVNNFAVFVRNDGGTYTYYGAYSGWKLAFEAARTATNGSATAYDEAVVYMLRDSTETSTPYHQNASGIINVDLNGKKLIVKSSLFNTNLISSNSPTSVINIFNGTLHTYKYGLIYTALKSEDTTYETAGIEKTITLNFTNVDLGFEERTDGTNDFLLAYAYSGSPTLNMTVNMNFDGCSFDLVNNATTSTLLGRGKTIAAATKETNTVDFNLAFTGCDFYVYNPAQISMAMSAEGDSFVINKGADGKYATVITNSSKEEVYANIISGNNGTDAVMLRTSYVGQADGYAKYELVETADGTITVNTAYGKIPEGYVNSSMYPFVVFHKAAGAAEYTFVSGYTKWSDAIKAAQAKIAAASGATEKDSAVILLRCDFNIGTDLYSDAAKIGGHLTFDLDGHTMTLGTSLMSIRSYDYTTGKTCTTYVTVKNGSLVNNSKYGIVYSRIEENCTLEKTYYLQFDNVNFSYGPSATTKSLLIHSYEQSARSINTVINLTYNGCFFDIDTNVPASSVLCNLDTVGGANDCLDFKTVFNGCTFEGTDIFNIPLGDGDTLTFKGTTVLKVAEGKNAPAGSYTTDLGNAKFVKTNAKDGVYTLYILLDEEAASYAPKMSLTLDRSLVMNVYIPVDCTQKFTFNGVTYENLDPNGENVVTLSDGKAYYLVTVALGSSEAAKTLNLSASVTVGSNTATANYTFSILKYAAKLLADKDATDVEKELARDVLAYIKEAYNYVGFAEDNTAEEIARVNALIESIIGDYKAVPTESGETVNTGAVTAVTLNLDATPTIRFYVTDTAVEFYADGKKLNTVSGTDANGTYVELDVYAYALAETITYGNGGSYHISSFVNGAGENEKALVNAFVKYVESAAKFREQELAKN